MPQSSDLEEVITKARELVTPSNLEREALRRALSSVVSKLERVIEELNLDLEPVPVGSSVRDTWLPGDTDLDVFILFPLKSVNKEEMGDIVKKLAKKIYGTSYVERYAEHPYVTVKEVVKLGDLTLEYNVDLVPAYKVRDASQLMSSVDRTPLHNEYLKRKLNEEMATEVRLLKAFMKRIGVYGAEIRVEGFSGYASELLIVNYGSFLNVLRAAQDWKEPVYIDVEDRSIRELALRLFPGKPMIMVDPVDPGRNVTAALSRTQFYRFKAASKAFLKRPNIEFFRYRVPSREVRPKEVKELVAVRGTHLIVIIFSKDGQDSPDNLWGQAKRLRKLIEIEFNKEGFDALWVEGWTDEASKIVVAAELAHMRMPAVELREGPRVGQKGEEDFLKTYSSTAIGGPFIKEDRWYVFRRRRYTDASLLISDMVSKGRLPSYIKQFRMRIVTENELSWVDKWIIKMLWDKMTEREMFVDYLANEA